MKNNLIKQALGTETVVVAIAMLISIGIYFLFGEYIVLLFPAAGYTIYIIMKAFYNGFRELFRKSSTEYIPKGRKRPRGLKKYFLSIVFNRHKSLYDYEFTFTPFSYDDNKLNSYWMKLNGFSLTILPRIKKYDSKYSVNALTKIFKYFGYSFILPHHWDSYRIAWRYHRYADIIELALYSYIKGVRHIKKITEIERNKEINIGVKSNKKYIIAQCSDVMYNVVNIRKWHIGYKLRLYTLDEEGVPTHIFIKVKK